VTWRARFGFVTVLFGSNHNFNPQVSTNQPGLQIYTANGDFEFEGKERANYSKNAGEALTCSFVTAWDGGHTALLRAALCVFRVVYTRQK
jgi:hypothetical protein